MAMPAIFGLGLGSLSSSAQTVSVTDASGWNAWTSSKDGSLIADPGGDQQTGQTTDDFIGNQTYAAFQQKAGYLASDPTNEYIVFRVRMGEYASGSKGFGSGNGANLSLGIDLTGTGTLNLILDLHAKGTSQDLSFASPGAGLNNGPSTTSWGNFAGTIAMTSSTYNYQATTDGVTLNSNGTPVAGTENGSKTTGYAQNSWVTFAISYANLQAAIRAYAVDPTSGTPATPAFTNFTVNDLTGFSFIAFTSTQGNAINQDLLGTDGNTSSTDTFGNLGSGTPQIRPSGGPIPEPSSVFQLGGLLGAGLFMWACRRRRSERTGPAPR